MVNGSCVCGDWTYEYEGEPAGVVSSASVCFFLREMKTDVTHAVCHCIPCRKTAGSNGSFNLMIPNDKFKKLSGEDFVFERTGDSGKTVRYRNCGKCACVMAANAEAVPGVTILKGGTVDDLEEDKKHKPVVEIYIKNRPEWCAGFGSAQQKEVS